MNVKETILSIIGIALAVFIGVSAQSYLSPKESSSFSGAGGRDATDCAINSVARVAVGNQVATTVLSSAANRAWARIKVTTDTVGTATNTPAVSFGSAATLNTGFKLTTSTPSIDVGLNTDFPFTGSVSVITNNGSTTVEVTDCLYN